jgi:hypothetical protein
MSSTGVQVDTETEEESKLQYQNDTSFAPSTGAIGSNVNATEEQKQQQHQPQSSPSPTSEVSASPSGSEAVTSPASSTSAASASPSASPAAPSSPPATLAVRVHSLRSSYVALQNHYLQCDPLLIVAVDNRPLFKTSIRKNSTSCSWNLTFGGDVLSVPGGLELPTNGHAPVVQVAVPSLSTARLQVHQENYGRVKEEDDLGSASVSIEELVEKAWRGAAKAAVVPSSVVSLQQQPSDKLIAPIANEPGWYAVSVENAQLLERSTGRPVGEVSLQLSVHLEPYLRHLVATQTNLHLLASLVTAFMEATNTASTAAIAAQESPLRHLLLDASSLIGLIQLTVRAGADKGSMDGQRLRERLYPLLHRALDVYGPDVIIPALFANESAGWKSLWDLRLCVPFAQLASNSGWTLYATLLEHFFALGERAALILEPIPPPPVKSPEELEAERLAAEAAEKRAAKKKKLAAKAAAAAAADGDDSAPNTSRSGSASSSKKKKKSIGSISLPEPAANFLPPSKLYYGINSMEVFKELLKALHARLAGGLAGRRATVSEIDWSNASENKLYELSTSLDLLWRAVWFSFRYGDAISGELDHRIGAEHCRVALFGRENGDPHALWLQKVLVSIVKKTKDILTHANPELLAKLQQHADYFAKQFPTEAKPKKSNK